MGFEKGLKAASKLFLLNNGHMRFESGVEGFLWSLFCSFREFSQSLTRGLIPEPLTAFIWRASGISGLLQDGRFQKPFIAGFLTLGAALGSDTQGKNNYYDGV